MYQYICQQCGAPFEYRCKGRKFCSPECYRLSLRKRVTINCQYCGHPFDVIPRDAKKRKYCSYACNNKSRTENAYPFSTICPICGKEFQPSGRRGKKYCSLKCYRAAVATKPIKCLECGRDFIPINKKRKYCSLKCRDKAHSKQVTFTCEICGVTFQDREKTQRRFCSLTCRGKWQAQTWIGENAPAWTGGHEQYYGPNWASQKRKVKKRDAYTCQVCGYKFGGDHFLDVHHIKPFKRFNSDWETANQLDNLITLCRPCHRKVECKKIPCPTLSCEPG